MANPTYFEEWRKQNHGADNNADVVGVSDDSSFMIVGLANKTSLIYNGEMEVVGAFEADQKLASTGLGPNYCAIANSAEHVKIVN